MPVHDAQSLQYIFGHSDLREGAATHNDRSFFSQDCVNEITDANFLASKVLLCCLVLRKAGCSDLGGRYVPWLAVLGF